MRSAGNLFFQLLLWWD